MGFAGAGAYFSLISYVHQCVLAPEELCDILITCRSVTATEEERRQGRPELLYERA